MREDLTGPVRGESYKHWVKRITRKGTKTVYRRRKRIRSVKK